MDDPNLQVAPQGEETLYVNPTDDRSAFDRFAEVFVSPASASAGLAQSPKRTSIILWGLVIGVLVNLLTVGLWSASPALVEQTRQMQIEPVERLYDDGKITKKQYEEIVAGMEASFDNPYSLQTILSVTLIPIAGWAIAAAVVMGIGRAVGSSDQEGMTYSTAFSLYLIALMIPLLEKIITTVAMFVTENIKFSLSAAALVNSDNQILSTALGFLNPFTFWWVFALGTGIAVAADGSRSRAILFWAAFYVFISLFFAAISQLFGGFFGS